MLGDPRVADQAVQVADILGGLDDVGTIGFRGHIVPDEGRGRLELGGKRLPLIVQHAADHHLRASTTSRRASAAPWSRDPSLTGATLLWKRTMPASFPLLPPGGLWRIGSVSSRWGDLLGREMYRSDFLRLA